MAAILSKNMCVCVYSGNHVSYVFSESLHVDAGAYSIMLSLSPFVLGTLLQHTNCTVIACCSSYLLELEKPPQNLV